MFSKDLVFNEFNIANVENKVKAKYSIKNNNKEESVVFLPTKNHSRANINSISIFRPNAINRCIVLFAGSFLRPLKKMKRQMMLIKENENNSHARSLNGSLITDSLMSKYPGIARRILNNRRSKRYLRKVFKDQCRLIKSLSDV